MIPKHWRADENIRRFLGRVFATSGKRKLAPLRIYQGEAHCQPQSLRKGTEPAPMGNLTRVYQARGVARPALVPHLLKAWTATPTDVVAPHALPGWANCLGEFKFLRKLFDATTSLRSGEEIYGGVGGKPDGTGHYETTRCKSVGFSQTRLTRPGAQKKIRGFGPKRNLQSAE